MCGRFTYLYDWKDLVAAYNAFLVHLPIVGDGVEDQPPRHNIAPTQPILVLRQAEGGNAAELMRWGLVPRWVKDPRAFPLVINARVETIREKPTFRGSLSHHRCIVPASGYYEWRKGPDGKKQPYYITRADGRPMSLAGIYSDWIGPDGEEIDTAAIVTLPAGPELRTLHDRMPAMIADARLGDWLAVRHVGENDAFAMLQAATESGLAFHPVSTRVNSVRNDDPGLIDETPETLPPPPKKASGQMDLF